MDNHLSTIKTAIQAIERILCSTFFRSSFALFGVQISQTNVQFTQLFFIHQRWCLREQTLGALGFGEGDHVPDGLGTRHQGDDAV